MELSKFMTISCCKQCNRNVVPHISRRVKSLTRKSGLMEDLGPS